MFLFRDLTWMCQSVHCMWVGSLVEAWWMPGRTANSFMPCSSRQMHFPHNRFSSLFPRCSSPGISLDDQHQPVPNISFRKKNDKKDQKSDKKWSRHPHLAALPQTPSDRDPARHPTVKMSLQSESSLKGHLHCLGPRAASRRLPMRVGGHRGIRAGRRWGVLMGME